MSVHHLEAAATPFVPRLPPPPAADAAHAVAAAAAALVQHWPLWQALHVASLVAHEPPDEPDALALLATFGVHPEAVDAAQECLMALEAAVRSWRAATSSPHAEAA